MFKINYILLFLVIFTSCSDKGSPYYVVSKVRIPVAQIFSKTSQTGQGCGTGLIDNNTWCQQFPMRPLGTLNAATAGNNKLKFLALAPENSPVTITLKSLKILDISTLVGSAGNGTRGFPESAIRCPDGVNCEIGTSALSINLNASLSSTVESSPMQIQTIVYDIEPPTLATLEAYATSIQAFPGFVLTYTATSANGSYVDNGYITFYALPEIADTSSWIALESNLSSFVNSITFRQAQLLATQNIPIQINSVSPIVNSNLIANQDNSISGNLTYNPSPNSFSPLQWYVSSGTLKNQNALSTNWNPDHSGTLTSVLVTRDLLGGSDYRVTNYTGQ